MTREEAIKEIKSWDFLEGKEIEAIETLVPELTESEDEKFRKYILKVCKECVDANNEGLVLSMSTTKKLLAYLEKQKEQIPYTDFVIKPHKGDDTNPYDMQASEALEYAIKRGFGVPFNDGEVYVDVRHMTQTIGNIIRWADEHPKEQKPILEVFGFKVGDAVRLKDGDGRKHIIKSFEEVEGVHGPNFYHVEFEDNSARDGIYPGEKYPNGYYTQMEKFEEEQKPVTNDRQQECPYKDLALVKNFFGEYKRKCKLSNKACDSKECEQWNELQSEFKNINEAFEDGKKEVIANPEKYGLCDCKPAEWSEEDKKMIDHLIEALPMWANGRIAMIPSQAEEYVKRLKSLRSQPKQDVFPSLSEKEIICLKRALDYLRKEHNRYGGEDFTNEIAVLEWLITHPILVSDTHWKPSEEQMKQLKDAADLHEFGPFVTSRKQFPDLESLYEHFLRN